MKTLTILLLTALLIPVCSVCAQTSPDGRDILQRMLFYNITDDNGNTWQLRWRIYYKRKAREDKVND